MKFGVGDKIGERTIIAEHLNVETGASLVCCIKESDTTPRYVIMWVKEGNDETGTLGYRWSIADHSDDFLKAANAFDFHLFTLRGLPEFLV